MQDGNKKKCHRRDFFYCIRVFSPKTYLEQVVDAPGQDDNVVDIQQGHDHNGGITNTWRDRQIIVMRQKDEVQSNDTHDVITLSVSFLAAVEMG